MSRGHRYITRTEDSAAASYSIVVPPGFVHLPGGGDAEASAASVLSCLPPAVAQDASLVSTVVSGLTQVFAVDKSDSLLDAFIVPGPIPGVDLACSVIVASVIVPPGQGGDLDAPLLHLVASRSATVCSLGGDPAVVWDERGGASLGGAIARRTVVARMPGVNDRLISFSMDIVRSVHKTELPQDTPAGERLVLDALIALFDGMLASVRWLDEEGRALVGHTRDGDEADA